MANKNNSKGGVVSHAQNLLAGTDKHLANATQVMLAGGSHTPAQITTKLQSIVQLRADVNAARATAKAKLAAEQAAMPSLLDFMSTYETFVKAAFSSQPEVLADFGINPKPRAQLTAEAKTAAAAKRKATRQARRTMGTQQKKSVKGAVTGILVTPITANGPVTATTVSPSAPAASPGTTATATIHAS